MMTDQIPSHHINDISKDMYRWVPQSCPTCEVPPTELMGRRGGVAHREQQGIECEIWRCGRCGLIFPNPMPIPVNGPDQHYGVPADDYFQNHDIDEKGGTALRMLEEAQELIGGKGHLLDIGSGRGELLRAAQQTGWSATGIDPSAGFAEYASNYSGVEVKRLPVEQCGFSENSFDVVILSAVLEHLYNPDETIKEIARILRPGGVLFVDVPNEEGLYFRVGNFYQKVQKRNWVVNLSPTFEPFHVFGFSPRSLRALLAKHGLSPKTWHVYAGRSVLPAHGGIAGKVEQVASHAVTVASNIGELGTYIETWAVKL